MSDWLALLRRDGAAVDPGQRTLALAALEQGEFRGRLHVEGPMLLVGTEPAERDAAQSALLFAGNLRLDNRDDLAQALGIGHWQADPAADRDLFLQAYRAWGPACIGRLVGEFAFVLWDAGERRLLAARDAIGVRPLYLHRGPDLLLAGPRIRPLLAFPEVSRELDPVRVGDFLELLTFDQESTFYEGVKRIPPGHVLTVEDGRERLERHHSFDPQRELEPQSDGAYAEQFRALLTEAVRCRLIDGRPAGALLSGGLDTSSILCLASRLPGHPVGHAFSAVFDVVPECDEREFMAPVVQATGVQHHLFHADRTSPLADWPGTLATFEEPAYAANFYLATGLYGLARDAGVERLLEGWGGDSVVGYGFERLLELLRSGRWISLYRETSALARRVGRGRSKILARFVREPLMRGLRARLGRAGGHGPVLSETTHPEFARRLGLADRVMQHRATNGAPSQTARSAMFQELESGRFSQGFELLDRTRRSSNLCIEFPFFDRRLMEFCLALPASQRLRDGWTRFVQRRAMQGIVPEPVLRRAWKTNLGPSFLHGLLQFERGTLEELAHGKGERIDEFVDRPALRRLYARFLTEHSPADAFELVKVLGLAQWLRCSPDVQRRSSMSDIESKP